MPPAGLETTGGVPTDRPTPDIVRDPSGFAQVPPPDSGGGSARRDVEPFAIMPAETSGREITNSISPAPRGGAATVEFSHQQRSGEQPPVVLLEALFGRFGDSVEFDDRNDMPRRRGFGVERGTAFAPRRDTVNGLGFATFAEQRAGKATADPQRVLQRISISSSAPWTIAAASVGGKSRV